jgi:2,5-furandicarboxylate decarboxylase 1
MQADLRAGLARLEAHARLLRVRRPVDPRTELAALITEAEGRGQAILFESVVGSTMPVVANVVGGRRLLALGLGLPPEALVPTFLERSRRRVPPVVVGDAPVQEVVRTGADVDLRGLPLVVHSEKDAAPYVTAGLVVAKDPETGIRNISFNRMMLRGPDEVGIRMMPPQHLGQLYDRAGARGQGLPVAVAIGNHPAELVAGATTLPFGDDELGLAGSLRGEPLLLAKCVTVDLEVPARAEIVLEGEVLPGVAEPEGPYGDFMQFYIPVMANRVLRIHAITHRRDAIHQTMHAGQAEDTALLAVSREAQLLEAVQASGADVREVSLLPTILAAAIAIRKRFEGEPKQVMAAAFGRYRWLKLCVVVDPDVDVLDPGDVWWAIATRSRLGDGVMHLTGVAGFPRDPHGLHTAKLGIDATIPLGQWAEYERKRPPGHGRVRLDDFLDS